MRVYIIALQSKMPFAQKLLEDIKNVRIISRPLEDETIAEIGTDIKRRIAAADVVLAIIDEESINNVMFNAELQLALMENSESRRMLLPVILNDVTVPAAIEDTLYINCHSESEEELKKIKMKIMRAMEHNRYIVRTQKQKEKKSRTFTMLVLTLAIELLTALFVVLIINGTSANIGSTDNESVISLFLVLVMAVVSIMPLFTSYLSIIRRKQKEDEEEEIESYSRRLKRAIVPEESKTDRNNKSGNEETKNEIDALGKMMINLEDIKEFYTWSQKQAKASFALAVFMCISGFILIAAAVLLLVAFRLSFRISIIAAIGGVVTEVIAGTALVVYRNSLSQLNHYHKALHEDERFLSSVNLLRKFSTAEAQDDVLREIIRSEIQMNLAVTQENENLNSHKPSAN